MNLINKNSYIFLAGHKGMVGKAIRESLLKNGYKNLLLPDREELDLLNNKAVEEWFRNNSSKRLKIILRILRITFFAYFTTIFTALTDCFCYWGDSAFAETTY